MPNHVINEVIFSNMNGGILADVINAKGKIDFGILLPPPLNAWMCSCSSLHEKTFKLTMLDWSRDNWGTKWSAYGLDQGDKYQSVVFSDDRIVLTFQTAWQPPYGWLLAIFNKFKVSFQHNWLDEGAARGICGTFNYAHYEDGGMQGEPYGVTPSAIRNIAIGRSWKSIP